MIEIQGEASAAFFFWSAGDLVATRLASIEIIPKALIRRLTPQRTLGILTINNPLREYFRSFP